MAAEDVGGGQPGAIISQKVYRVVLKKSIPAQFRQLIRFTVTNLKNTFMDLRVS